MKKKTAAVVSICALGLVPAAPGFAAIDEGPGKGNPDLSNGSQKCPPGQNKDTSVGGLKKCPD